MGGKKKKTNQLSLNTTFKVPHRSTAVETDTERLSKVVQQDSCMHSFLIPPEAALHLFPFAFICDKDLVLQHICNVLYGEVL